MFMHKYIYADVSLCPCMCMHSCVYSLCTGMFGHIYAQIQVADADADAQVQLSKHAQVRLNKDILCAQVLF